MNSLNLGDIYRKTDRIDDAISHFFTAKNKLEDGSNILFDAMLDHSLGLSYSSLDSLDQALLYFHQGLSKAKAVKGFSHIHHISQSLSNFHEKVGNKDSAFVYLNQSKIYQDSLDLKNTAEKLLREELLSEFKLEKNQIQQLYEKNKKILFLLLICMVLVSLTFYFRANWIKKNLVKVESEKNNLTHLAEENFEKTQALERKVEHTQKELTLASMQAIQKDEMLKTLSKSLTSKNSTSQIIDQDKIAKILDGLTSDQSESALSEFELRFSNVYVGFFEKLLNEYPALSQNERRLCAFLKLSMTTKEIAAITGQSIRAIEIARTRLRKKIKLTNSEKNLYDFFVNY